MRDLEVIVNDAIRQATHHFLSVICSSDVVLGLGPWLSLRTKFQSLVLAKDQRLVKDYTFKLHHHHRHLHGQWQS